MLWARGANNFLGGEGNLIYSYVKKGLTHTNTVCTAKIFFTHLVVPHWIAPWPTHLEESELKGLENA